MYLTVTGCHQSSARLFCRPPYPRSTFQQVILSRQGHRQSKSFTLMAIVKQRGPLSTTMRVEPRNHTGCIAMKRETRVDNILRQSSANIVFRKTGTVETINYLSAALSSGAQFQRTSWASSSKQSEASSTASCSAYERERHIAKSPCATLMWRNITKRKTVQNKLN